MERSRALTDELPDEIERKVCAKCGKLPPCVEHYHEHGIRVVKYVRATAAEGAVDALEIALDGLERTNRDDAWTYEYKKAVEDYVRSTTTGRAR